MKRGLILVIVLFLSVVSVHANFFSGSIWGNWLTGNVVNSNKDFTLADVGVDKSQKLVIAKVCNTGDASVNFGNIHFVTFEVNSNFVNWVFPEDKGYDNSGSRELYSSTLYIGECFYAIKSFAALGITDAMERIDLTPVVDPENRYIEADEENNKLKKSIVLRESVVVEVTNISEDVQKSEEVPIVIPRPAAKAPPKINIGGGLIVLVLAFAVIVYFVHHRKKQVVVGKRPLRTLG